MKKSKSLWKEMKMNIQQPKNYGHSKGSPEREVHSNTGLPNRDRNISNKQLKLASTRTEGTTTVKAQNK